MTMLTWDTMGKRLFETGTDRGVLYIGGVGIPWNGLNSVAQSPSGGEAQPYYLDGVKYLNSSAPEEFNATIAAYSYPDEFMQCDGSQAIANGLTITAQDRKEFGFSYRTVVGNDLDGLDHGYKIHIIYNAKATPSQKAFKSLGASADPVAFQWNISSRAVPFTDAAFGTRYGAHVVLDSTKIYPWAMTAVENVLYGTATTDPYLPTPSQLLALFIDNALLKITDNGDGTWTADGPVSIITTTSTYAAFTESATPGLFTPAAGTTATDTGGDGMFTVTSATLRESTSVSGIFMNEDLDQFQINWPSAIFIDADSYKVSSL